MKVPRSTEELLDDIVTWGDKLARHPSDVTEEAFLKDEKTQDAVTKCAEAIGAAAGEILKAEPEIEFRHPELQLRNANALRNRLSHGYHAIDYEILWNTVSFSIPGAVDAARAVLATRRAENFDGLIGS